MHDRIADENDIDQTFGGFGRRIDESTDHGLYLIAKYIAEDPESILRHREADTAHDVRTVFCLMIQGSGDTADGSCFQVDKLRNEGGRADINGDPDAVTGGEIKYRFIGKDGGLPLRDMKREIPLGRMSAGKSPAVQTFFAGQALSLFVRYAECAIDNPHTTALAAALAATREFHSMQKEKVLKIGPGGCGEGFAERDETYVHALTQRAHARQR
jgi:hypothetical protein